MSDPHEDLLEESVRTPAWLPIVGLVLFFAAAVWLVAGGGEPEVTLEVPAADGGTAAAGR